MLRHMRTRFILLLSLLSLRLNAAQPAEPNPTVASLAACKPLPAPPTPKLLLKKGDRLAICGDSITEQKMYSRLMEDYLTVCVPQLAVTARQYGWGGERAPGFLARMTNDCLRFKPTIATTCYGMNDHEYRAYTPSIGETYRRYETAIDEAFQAYGVRVVEGSAGSIGKVPRWSQGGNTLEQLNVNLCTLRNIGIKIAKQQKVGFADVFWPMLSGAVTAQKEYGAGYQLEGKDGVHPNWAGHTIMAYAFLRALGLDGEIGTFSVNLKRMRMRASAGHKVLSARDGIFELRSTRYPFCPCEESGQEATHYPVCGQDDVTSDASIRSGMSLVPFNQQLNRLMLVAKGGRAQSYKVTWGDQSKSFSAEQLAQGVNLAAEFPCNPFCPAFARVDAAVAAKEAFETKEIKQDFRSPEAKQDMAAVVARDEQQHQALAAALKAAFAPVTHTLRIQAE